MQLSSLVLLLLLTELAFLFSRGILVLLVLGDEIVHVGLGLSELHLIHTLTSVPVQESLAPEHGSELLRDTLEHLLDGSAVTNEGSRHLKTLRRDIANGGLDIVGDPLNEVRRVLVLDVKHLLIDLLGGHTTTEKGGGGEVTTVAGISGAHHVLGIPHLLGKLGDGEGTVLLAATGGEGGETNHEEVETGEGDKVDGKLTEISVELTGEAEAAGDAGHDGGDKMVKVTEGGGGELKGAEADIVESLVIEDHALIGVLNELMNGEGGVVGLNDGIRHLGGGDDGEGEHHAVRVLLTDLGNKEGSHTGTGTTTERVADLEALKAIAGLSLLADNIKDRVNELSTLSVVTLSPVVTGTSLAEDKVVRAENLTIGTRADGIHGTGLKIHEDGTGDIAASSGLVEVDVDALKLEVAVTKGGTGGVDAVLIRDDLPELGTDLVTALATLNMNYFTHGYLFG
mmetsp:Transcript_3264/g.5371  ORF Transcript_3264/g.5371 Transcript_3264/m.5371 type:complete len:455 (+) Transcript_3264:329-1693(+)